MCSRVLGCHMVRSENAACAVRIAARDEVPVRATTVKVRRQLSAPIAWLLPARFHLVKIGEDQLLVALRAEHRFTVRAQGKIASFRRIVHHSHTSGRLLTSASLPGSETHTRSASISSGGGTV